MKRAPFYLKTVLAAVLVAGLGSGAALVAVKIFFPEPRARAWLGETARRQLGREVRLRGLDIGLRGLRLRGLEISERPDFAAGTFLRVETFRLRPSWRALLKRRLIVAAVAADGLKVRVVKDADGKFNYETLVSSSTPAAAATPSKPGEAPAPEMDVRRASISGATIEYVDSGAAWTLTDLDLDVSDFAPGGPFGLRTSFNIRGRTGTRAVDARAAFDGRVNLARGDREKFKAEFKSLVVEQQGVKLSASGALTRLDALELVFVATLSTGGRELIQVVGSAKLAESGQAEAKWKTPGLDGALLAKLAPQAGLPPANVPAAQGAFAVSFSADAADVRSFQASWVGGKLEGAGSVRGLKSAKPAYEGRVAFGLGSPEIRPGQYPFLKLPPKLALPALRLDGEFSLRGDELKISALTAKAKAGTIAAAGAVRGLTSAKPIADVAVTLALDLPAFKLSELPVALSGLPGSFAVPAGRLEGTVRASGDDARLEKLSFQAKGAQIFVDGTIAHALSGSPAPDVAVAADLALPALTDKDLPFPGVPSDLRMPPSHWTAALSYSPRLIRVKSLRVATGRNDVEASGTVTDPSGRGAYDLLFKCRSFVLEELTELTPRTRDLKLAGSGFFALSMTGVKEKPIFAGKLQFKDMGAMVAELPLADFTGTMSFDAKRIDVPNLTGKVADGLLKMDLTVKNYALAPLIELEASLDRFDLGRYLAAKAKLSADRSSALAAKPAQAPAGKSPTLISTRGHLDIGAMAHPNATVTDVKVGWDLRDLGADLRGLSGDAKFHVGGGKLRSVGDMATQSKLVKVLLFPLLVVQKIGRVGGIRLFPDFNDITLEQIVGDYGFSDGVMTLRQSEMDSDVAQVSAKGTINLPAEALDLVITAQVGRVAPIDVAVAGTFDKPKSKVNIGKFLADPAKQLIQGLLNK